MELNKLTIVAATGNRHKLEEIGAITSKFGMNLISKKEAGAGDVDPEETGITFEENSEIKARAIMEATGMPAVADDSGLEVDCLNGAPGVYSARFSALDSAPGVFPAVFSDRDADDSSNNARLLELLAEVPEDKPAARFVSVVTIVFPDGKVLSSRGECPGYITRTPAGTNGFGYDPLFVPEGYCGRTYAQLSPEEKNENSHRARALRGLEEMLEKL